ncbi:MAG: hypothetical protein V1646_02090 [bacterium]
MKKSNIGLIVTFLIISAVSCLFGMKREACGQGDGVPVKKAQRQEPAKQVPVTLVGLINNGSDCFVNSAIQVLYAIPAFWEFLNTHRQDYFLDGHHGPFSIPGQLIQIFEELQRSSVAESRGTVSSKVFREFVCKNGANSALSGMSTGQHDSGEILKLLLEHFQYYTKYHLDLLNMLASLMPSDDGAVCDLLKKELIDLVILDISDFNNTDQLSFSFFAERVKRRTDELRLKISKAKLKETFQRKDFSNFAEYALSTKKLINDLGRQESEEFFGKISDFIQLFKNAKTVCDLFQDSLQHDDGNLIMLQVCFGGEKNWEWLKDKVKYLKLTCDDTIYLNKCDVLNKYLDVILERIGAQDLRSRLDECLRNIQRNLFDFRHLFCSKVNGNWQVCLNLISPLGIDFQVLAEIATPLQPEAEYRKDSRPRLKLEDLLNLFVQFDDTADMPEILIVQPKSFTDEDCQLPEIKKSDEQISKTFGFEMFSGEFLRQGMKFPLVYMPGRILNIRNQPYELIGMIYHHGSLASRGHFIAACKYGSSWKIFNDERVSDFNGLYIARGEFTVHVAIYRKVHSAPLLPPVVENVASHSVVKQ